MKKTYTQSAEEVLREVGVGAEGLTTAQAQERLAKYGPNKLKEAEKPTLMQRFIAQLKDPHADHPDGGCRCFRTDRYAVR